MLMGWIGWLRSRRWKCHFNYHDWEVKEEKIAVPIFGDYYETYTSRICKRCGRVEELVDYLDQEGGLIYSRWHAVETDQEGGQDKREG